MSAPRALLAAAAALSLAPWAVADHPQTESGRTVAFGHRAGNEWWVEAVLAGPDAGLVSGVEAMDTGGAWVPLSKRSGGAWAGSFHVEPGNEVRFRATWPGGAQAASCWFAHPAGTERCGFEASVLRAKGNEWWVEAKVAASEPLAGVDARVGCAGEWRPLALRSWGNWAASFHVPAGSVVDFRARATSGAADLSGGYAWPQATPTAPCPEAFDASFPSVKGNAWWVEAKVVANAPVAGVDARAGCAGDWRPLALRSWGNWAASFHVPAGSSVDFRARGANGAIDQGPRFAWPPGQALAPCAERGAWPAAGSFAEFTLHAVDEGPGSPVRRVTDATLRVVYDGAHWSGLCRGTTHETDSSAGTSRTWEWTADVHEGPPRSATSPAVGSTFPVSPLVPSPFGGCGRTEEVVQVTGKGMVDTALRGPDGQPRSMMAWIGEEPEGESGHHDSFVAWDTALGLLLLWEHGGHAGSYEGELTATDAPVG